MKYISLALVAVMVAPLAFMGCGKKDDAPQPTSKRMLNPPSAAPKTIFVRVNERTNQVERAEVNREVDSSEVNSVMTDPKLKWRPVAENQVISQKTGFPNNPDQNTRNQQYFVQDPNNYSPHPQQPMGQGYYNNGSPYSMGTQYSQNAQNYPGMMGGGGQYGQNYPGMISYYRYGGGVYAPGWGYGNGGYGYAYGYGYGYAGYPNYYGYGAGGGGCGGGSCGAYNHYYPYYYGGYNSYAYQPSYYAQNSYWYYYNYSTPYYNGGYNYYAYAGWWY